ncbi:Fc.00g067340.m01.CDS01 [Cosmosporella sp. VM-42]
MAPTRSKKRASDQSTASVRKQVAMADQKIPLRAGSPSTPHQRSPIKKRKGGITLIQKQALIDNIQLEITERARRLRAQYNLQAQGLRSRIEIRVNRIPMSLRKIKMGDLLLKYIGQDEKRTTRQMAATKDHAPRLSPHKQTQATSYTTKSTTRAQKRMSDAISGDKENEIEHLENAKKRVRGAQAAADAAHIRPAQVLSPTTSNSRLANRSRPASPTKSQIARPASPLKNSGTARSTAAATNMLSSMVEKAKATRAGATRKVTATSSTSSSSNSTTAAPRARRAPAPRAPPSRPATRNARRVSGNSETSEASTGTVVKRSAATRATASTAKKGVMGSLRRGVTGGTKKTTTKAAAPAPATGTGRVLRNRRG